MRKKFQLMLLSVGYLSLLSLYAEEGMWIPSMLGELKIGEMQEKGLHLSAEDIYNVNSGGIMDAVVNLGGFCTASVISDEGLIISNHHCGLRAVQSHSTMANNYLSDGFWAMTRSEELPNPGLYVRFLRQILEVSDVVLDGVEQDMSESQRSTVVNLNIAVLKDNVRDTSDLLINIISFNYGNDYYLFLYEEFNDVRLVGAPPLSIGRFGGDIDNWMWPRHNGDFSLLRIYADAENKPASYSPDNVAYRPSKHLEISLEGVKEEDFTMVLGYPGTTNQHMVSGELKNLLEESLPRKVRARTARMEVMEKYMNLDEEINLKYASKYSGVSNYQKKWRGQISSMKRSDILVEKQLNEQKFSDWAAREESGRYAGLVDSIHNEVREIEGISLLREYETEVVRAIEIIRFASEFGSVMEAWNNKDIEEGYFDMALDLLKEDAEKFYRDYSPSIDMEVAATLLEMYYRDVNNIYHPEMLKEAALRFQGDFYQYALWLFSTSQLVSKEVTIQMLENFNQTSWEKISEDPFYRLSLEYEKVFGPNDFYWSIYSKKKIDLYRAYIEGLGKWEGERVAYPDANRTMRISFGSVEGYRPRDAIHLGFLTTIEGIIEKNNQHLSDFDIPDKLLDLYKSRDYGIYSENGTLPVCFIASNHTTNGNSGSPTLNANGHLIGVNFDRNQEGTISDYTYVEDQCRNISVDIRYVLFIIDRLAGAGHLLEEMDIIY
jgi:hypothetical protein